MAILVGLPGILAAVLVVFAFVLLARPARAEEKSPVPALPAEVTVKAVKGLTRAEIQQKLQKLKDAPAPAKVAHGAKCYAMFRPPGRAEYVCPKCGEKTLYTNQMAKVVTSDLICSRARFGMLQKAAGEGVSLDESEFCRKCSPDVKDPKLVLKIAYTDGNPKTVVEVDMVDILLLAELFSGELTHCFNGPDTEALKNHFPRLQQLLGVEAK
jgi:predicted RNA-binding Zn-ribbon protein involved in translation (DUF1610 family)